MFIFVHLSMNTRISLFQETKICLEITQNNVFHRNFWRQMEIEERAQR